MEEHELQPSSPETQTSVLTTGPSRINFLTNPLLSTQFLCVPACNTFIFFLIHADETGLGVTWGHPSIKRIENSVLDLSGKKEEHCIVTTVLHQGLNGASTVYKHLSD